MWKYCRSSLTSQVEMWGFQDAPPVGQRRRCWLSGRNSSGSTSSGSTLFVGCLRVTSSRNHLASRQLNRPNFACQHYSVIRPYARQMSWQKIRQVQWKPACFLAHLPQNRAVATWNLSFAWNALVEVCSPGASPASTTEESWLTAAGWDRHTLSVSILLVDLRTLPWGWSCAEWHQCSA